MNWNKYARHGFQADSLFDDGFPHVPTKAGKWSWFEIVGFAVLVAGTIGYALPYFLI